MPARKTIVPAEYQIDLDRVPAQPAGGCGALLLVICGLIGLAGGGLWLLTSQAAAQLPATETAIPLETLTASPTFTDSPTQTLDAWDMTGTAYAMATVSPTVDYCFWLTPTVTPLPTVAVVDDWMATGTAIYEATHPYQSPTPTPDVPRAWCNTIPSDTPTVTPTETPGAPTLIPTEQPTDKPAPPAHSGSGSGSYPPTAPPVIIQPTVQPTVIQLPTSTPTDTPTGTPESSLISRLG